MKVWVVVDAWDDSGYDDDYENHMGGHIKGIFDTEEKAINCIQDMIRSMLEYKSPLDDPIDLEEVPSVASIKKHNNGVLYRDYYDGTRLYCFCKEYEVK